MRTITILLFFLGPALLNALSNQKGNDAALRAVEAFCQSEFDGILRVEARKRLVVFAPARIKKWERTESEISPFAVIGESDPIVVVASYVVRAIRMQNETSAIAEVEYKRLARRAKSSEEGGILKSDYKVKDVIKLELHKINGHWRVYEPVAPRIGVKALIKIYEDSLKSYSHEWLNNASKGDLESYKREKEELKLLRGIRVGEI